MFSGLFSEPVILCALGAILYHFYWFIEKKSRTKNNADDFKTSALAVLAHLIFAIVIGYCYFKNDPNASGFTCLHVGATSPWIFKGLMKHTPNSTDIRK